MFGRVPAAPADALVYGSAADVETFYSVVRSCDCASPFLDVWQDLVDSKAEVRLYVSRDLERHVRTAKADSRNVVFVDMLDSLGTGEHIHLLDLADLDAFPRILQCGDSAAAVPVLPVPPWASSRCSILLHVLSEARRMAEGASYEAAHAKAIDDENRLRSLLGQKVKIRRRLSGPEKWAESAAWGGSTWIISCPHITLFDGARSEVYEVDEDGQVILPPTFEPAP
jgi:hypothetical protein